jgi:hypothetical protein
VQRPLLDVEVLDALERMLRRLRLRRPLSISNSLAPSP